MSKEEGYGGAPWSRDGIVAALREHGYTMFCALAAVIAAVVVNSDLKLESFSGRAIGAATMANVDVEARVQVFLLCLAAGAAIIAVCSWALPRLQQRFGRELFDTLNAGAVAGAVLVYLRLWGEVTPAAFDLCVAFLALLILVYALDRLGLRSTRACDLGRDLVWLASIAWCVAWLAPDFADTPFALEDAGRRAARWVLLCGAGLYLVRWVVSRRGNPVVSARSSDRFVYGISALAVIPFAVYAHREVFLTLNGRGYTSLEPEFARTVVFCALGMWCVTRMSCAPRHVLPDGRLDVDRLLARFVFPWIIVGYGACLRSVPIKNLPNDFFEPGNPGLLVQQWFDFGRVPFLETFSAHGLSDSFFAFVHRVLTGTHQASGEIFFYWYWILADLAVFHVLRLGLRGCATRDMGNTFDRAHG